MQILKNKWKKGEEDSLKLAKKLEQIGVIAQEMVASKMHKSKGG